MLEVLLELLADGSDMIDRDQFDDEDKEIESDWLSIDVLELVELSEYDVGSDFTTKEP